MVTVYLVDVPCSYCGKIRQVKIKGYCSGSCKVKAFREKGKVVEEDGDYAPYKEPKVFPPDKFNVDTDPIITKPEISEPKFSAVKKSGYKFNPTMNCYIKES